MASVKLAHDVLFTCLLRLVQNYGKANPRWKGGISSSATQKIAPLAISAILCR